MKTNQILYTLATIAVAVAATMGWLDIELLSTAGIAVYALIFGFTERNKAAREKELRVQSERENGHLFRELQNLEKEVERSIPGGGIKTPPPPPPEEEIEP